MEENNLVPFVSQWMTVQPSLFGFLDDELGELDDEQKTFVRVCSWALAEQNFFQYRWCGNGRPPASRLAIFKAFILKARRVARRSNCVTRMVLQLPLLYVT